MATTVLTPKAERPTSALEAKLAKSTPGRAGILTFILILIGGLAYIGDKLYSALSAVHSPTVFAFFLLGIALLIALGFEFVNGFLDTANAVATSNPTSPSSTPASSTSLACCSVPAPWPSPSSAFCPSISF
jgi:hypothetical protein